MVEAAAVLERLDTAGVTLEVGKCTFGATSIEYLRHHLGPDCMRSLQRLVTAIEKFPQLMEDLVAAVQQRSNQCRDLAERGSYKGMLLRTTDGVLKARTDEGCRTVLPVELWATAFNEAHGSIWAGHLREPQTLARLKRAFWWPQMRASVAAWVIGRQDCGSRKVRSKLVVPPLRSVGVGERCDRWAMDLAGLLHVTPRSNTYVVAFVEYLSKYAIAVAVPNRAATTVARTLMEEVMLRHGSFRGLLTNGAKELVGSVMEELTQPLQAKHTTPVPYWPNLVGLVQRFNRTWKGVVSMTTNATQDDWGEWLPAAAYAYKSARYTATGFAPFEIMYGRLHRAPGNLLRPERRESDRQARYYDRGVRSDFKVRDGLLVWAYKPPRGPHITKFRHQWRGPAVLLEAIDFDNHRILFLDTREKEVVHCSALVPYHVDDSVLQAQALDLASSLGDDAAASSAPDDEVVVALPVRLLTWPHTRLHQTEAGGFLAEVARRKRTGMNVAERIWVSLGDYELLWRDGRVEGNVLT
ncbi:hypothetical protein PybrP1_006413, partial [[Pythium] brassicae (nom. inval.)]